MESKVKPVPCSGGPVEAVISFRPRGSGAVTFTPMRTLLGVVAVGNQRFKKVYSDAVPQFLSAYRALNPNGVFDGPLARQLGPRDLANGL